MNAHQPAAPLPSTQRAPLFWGVAIIALLAVIVSLVLWFGPQTLQRPQTYPIGSADAGSTVDLQIGDIVLISLEGNPSTGYSWNVVQGDLAVVRLAGEPTFAPASSALGAGGTLTYRFEAQDTGQTTLELAYDRPFEPDTPPLQTFAITVRVSK
jgi:inhibitor of cysteine peptidase